MIERVEAAQDAIKHSRNKIQKFLANTNSPRRRSFDAVILSNKILMDSRTLRQSVGKIVNQANSVHRLLHEKTKDQLKDVGNADTSRKYFIN
jgi:16S rRNA U516 pseudouridylate synthase RsuA-like enzyme